MSQEQFAQSSSTQQTTFGQKSDTNLWISLGVGLVLIGAVGVIDWMSKASATKAAAKPATSTQQATAKSVAPVYQCAGGRVSFTPCS